jgi:hypothetical protein
MQDDAISSSGMEPDHPAVLATAHGVISPEMVQECRFFVFILQQIYLYFFLYFLCTIFNTASSAAPQIPLCIGGCWDRTPGQLQLLSDALTTRQDLIHQVHSSAITHPLIRRLDLIHNSARYHPQLGQISSTTQLEFIHNSARSHPQLS